MLPCAPVAKSRSTAAFSLAKRGQAPRRSMTFWTTRQTFPSAVSNALAIMPRTWFSSGRPPGSCWPQRAAAAASRSAAGSSSRWHAASNAAKSPSVAIVTRTSAINSCISSSIWSIEATWTSCNEPARSIGRHCISKPCSVAALSAMASRPTNAWRTAVGHPSGMNTWTVGMQPCVANSAFETLAASHPGASLGAARRRHEDDNAETTYGMRAATSPVIGMTSRAPWPPSAIVVCVWAPWPPSVQPEADTATPPSLLVVPKADSVGPQQDASTPTCPPTSGHGQTSSTTSGGKESEDGFGGTGAGCSAAAMPTAAIRRAAVNGKRRRRCGGCKTFTHT
mmetsp:Transcript_73361/g.203630  ORF Transcript_73361/g.203630 Transcript_73361/m.203630 type:complete len:338 (+) Transcript_73361:807-1820(+)